MNHCEDCWFITLVDAGLQAAIVARHRVPTLSSKERHANLSKSVTQLNTSDHDDKQHSVDSLVDRAKGIKVYGLKYVAPHCIGIACNNQFFSVEFPNLCTYSAQLFLFTYRSREYAQNIHETAAKFTTSV